jgi:hypothetical protein
MRMKTREEEHLKARHILTYWFFQVRLERELEPGAAPCPPPAMPPVWHPLRLRQWFS